jgi:peptidoglycan hydrolase CwlO-like protein
MSTVDTSSLIQYAGGISAGLLGIAFALQKLLTSWKTDRAEGSVISLMHTELERMSEQNTKLSIELGRLHDEVIILNTELQKLTLENQQLQAEVIALTNEISSLKNITKKE